ncbi:hypothetical protein FCE95_11295 [Luteimonas gilva]|uniref:Translation elongation factor EFTs/EF1B dimerisation domain-containing protein n=1 Tax=Luteimonas gilva TaxID=2572684 RepID=A0A4V5ZQA1_9GAMM|nr:hypothetical protein [Luteimonas gilva]TKR30683.1 hypothetical protein FCE95_11295 [Luteimonas gilva]
MNYTDRFIESYVHNGGIGVLIELGVSDPLIVKSDAFRQLAKDLAIHIAAMAPATVDDLMQQPFAKDPELTINKLVAMAADDFRDKIIILRFVRWSTEVQGPLQPEPPKSPAVIYNLRNPR